MVDAKGSLLLLYLKALRTGFISPLNEYIPYCLGLNQRIKSSKYFRIGTIAMKIIRRLQDLRYILLFPRPRLSLQSSRNPEHPGNNRPENGVQQTHTTSSHHPETTTLESYNNITGEL